MIELMVSQYIFN